MPLVEGMQVDPGYACDLQGCGQWFTEVSQHVWTVVNEALILNQPGAPHRVVFEVYWTWHKGDWVSRIGDVFVVIILLSLRCLE